MLNQSLALEHCKSTQRNWDTLGTYCSTFYRLNFVVILEHVVEMEIKKYLPNEMSYLGYLKFKWKCRYCKSDCFSCPFGQFTSENACSKSIFTCPGQSDSR